MLTEDVAVDDLSFSSPAIDPCPKAGRSSPRTTLAVPPGTVTVALKLPELQLLTPPPMPTPPPPLPIVTEVAIVPSTAAESSIAELCVGFSATRSAATF